ncbi:nitrate/nitrite two-component system sensor histidine kinase NarQ [Gallibacterium salpingitidis]|uniref:nitrate/nitrite two-component system sensor histidine kinase NarQ n=1 Tax=Gallibacterium salpingitidis TaxID=505341 RepID=UPI0009EDFFFF
MIDLAKEHCVKKYSVLTRVAKYLIGIIVLASACIALVFSVLLSSQSDAEAINLAGSLRMQAYRLVYQMEHEPDTISHNLAQYDATLDNSTLYQLQTSVVVPNSVKNAYQDVLRNWREMEGYVQQNRIADYQAKVDGYVQKVDHFVVTLQHFSERKIIMAILISIVSIAIILLIGSYIIGFIRREVLNPIEKLVQASNQVQTGQFKHIALDVDKSNELGTLSATFTKMSSELQKLYWFLEDKVSEKTKKLSQLNRTLSMLFHTSQKITHIDLSYTKLSEVLGEIRNSEHLRYIELIVYGAEHLDISAGKAEENYPWQEQPISINGKMISRLRWQAGLPCPDLRLMQSLAQMLGRSIYFIQTQRQQQQLVLMEERSIIARELHDSLAQVLAFLQIQLTLLKHSLKDSDPAAREKSFKIIADFEQALNDGYVQLRELLSTFRLTIQEANLQQALEQVIESLRNQTTAQITLDCSLPSQIFTAQQLVHALQVVREALLNAIKHSQATLIEVIAHTNEDGENEIIVADNGIGIPSLEEPEGHYGLNIMHERTAQLNAKLTIQLRPTGGTEVKILLADPFAQGQ